jgi:hypothetical protein
MLTARAFIGGPTKMRISHRASRARTFAQAWWEEFARKNLDSKHFQGQLWCMTMRARFPEDCARRPPKNGVPDLEMVVERLLRPHLGPNPSAPQAVKLEATRRSK